MRGYSRVEIPAPVVTQLRHRWAGLARAHTRRWGLDDLDGLLCSVYFQGVHDCAETLSRAKSREDPA